MSCKVFESDYQYLQDFFAGVTGMKMGIRITRKIQEEPSRQNCLKVV